MEGSGKKLIIETEDLPDLPPPSAPGSPSGTPGPSQGLPSVAGVKPAPIHVDGFGGIPALSKLSTVQSSLLAGLVAAALAWAPSDLLLNSLAQDSSPTTTTALWVGCFGLIFGAIFCSWDDVVAGVTGRIGRNLGVGAVAGAVAGAITGAVAQAIYKSISDSVVEAALEDASTEQDVLDAIRGSVELYAARGLGFALFGIGIGLAIGIAAQSQKKAINGVLGGAIGGLFGGLVLNYVFVNEILADSQGIARLISLLVLGGGIGVAIGLVEVVRRQAWLQIASGGMAGKEFIVYHEVTEIGASPKCQITLIKDPDIAPQHCRIIDQANVRTIEALMGNPTLVNGVPISRQRLSNGDQIQVGGTLVAYSEKAAVTA